MLKNKKILVLGILLMQVLFTFGQQDRVLSAYNFFQKGNLDSAKYEINLAVADTESVNDAEVWYLRGFVYRAIYLKNERGNKQSPSRIEGLNSFTKSLAMDTAKQNRLKNIESIKSLSSTLWNDIVASLDSIHYPLAIENFNNYKMYFKTVDSSSSIFKKMDIEFLNALSSVYCQIYESDKKGKADFCRLAKETYFKILAIDPNNYRANYNMGILFYNQAVNLITQSEYDIDIIALNDIQDNSIKLFKDALPYMEKANEIEPKRRETLLGLSGIYFSLNEKDKSELYKQKLQEIGN